MPFWALAMVTELLAGSWDSSSGGTSWLWLSGASWSAAKHCSASQAQHSYQGLPTPNLYHGVKRIERLLGVSLIDVLFSKESLRSPES